MQIIKSQNLLLLAPALMFMLLSSGCSNTAAGYQPIVDGPRNAKYSQNLQACQQVAQQRSYLNDDVKTEALLGGVIGALVSAADDDDDMTAAEGFLAGGVTGAAGRAWDTRTERKNIVIECMIQRGHRVVG